MGAHPSPAASARAAPQAHRAPQIHRQRDRRAGVRRVVVVAAGGGKDGQERGDDRRRPLTPGPARQAGDPAGWISGRTRAWPDHRRAGETVVRGMRCRERMGRTPTKPGEWSETTGVGPGESRAGRHTVEHRLRAGPARHRADRAIGRDARLRRDGPPSRRAVALVRARPGPGIVRPCERSRRP